MATISIKYGRQDADGVVGREATQSHALPTSEGGVIWVNVPVPAPFSDDTDLFVELPSGYTLSDAIGVHPVNYDMEWELDSGTRYTYQGTAVSADMTWLITFIAEPVAGIREPDVLTISFGRLDAGDDLRDGSEDVSEAVITTEGDAYWLSVPLQMPTTALPGFMYFDLPPGYSFLSATSLNGTAFEEDGWKREGATDRYVYRPTPPLAPASTETPWPTTILARPRVAETTIGVNGYCSVGDVIRASGVPNAPRLDVVAFIANGFDQINAQFNISSSELRLVPPIQDNDIIDALKRLNIDLLWVVCC